MKDQQEHEVINIDKTEIRGFSIKNLAAVITATATIVAFVLGTSYSIKDEITRLNLNYEKQSEMNAERYRTFDERMTHDESDIADIRKMKDKQQQ